MITKKSTIGWIMVLIIGIVSLAAFLDWITNDITNSIAINMEIKQKEVIENKSSVDTLGINTTMTIETGSHFTAITRVPGGLIYRTGRGCVFVPIKEK